MVLARTLVPLFVAAFSASLVAQDDGRLRPGAPADVGIDAAQLAAAAAAVADVVARDLVRGAVVMVVRDRVIVLHEAFGWRDVDGKLPMRPDSLFRMASNTKAFTAAAVLALADDGKVDLDAPVARWILAFDRGESKAITVRQLLTHTSGLRIKGLFPPRAGGAAEAGESGAVDASDAPAKAPTLQSEVARIGAIGPEVEPGTSYAYSNAGYNTLGALVEVVAERPLEDFLRARIYGPLGMTDTCNHESRADQSRMSAVFFEKKPAGWRIGWHPGAAPDLPFVRGSGGMISTAVDYAKFCQAMLDGGTYAGRRVLSEARAREATAPQGARIPAAKGYGLGWMTPRNGTFRHTGSDGTFAWIDPSRALIGMVLTQSPGDATEAMRKEFERLVTASCGELVR